MVKIQRDGRTFHVMVEVLRIFAEVCGEEVRWLESCHCHAEIWGLQSAFGTKRKRLIAATGCMWCCWKGKRAQQMARGRVHVFLQKVRFASSRRLKELLAMVPDSSRVRAITMVGRLRSKLIESLMDKLKFWKNFLWLFCGLYEYSWPADAAADPSLTFVRGTKAGIDCLREAVEEYDKLMATGMAAQITVKAHSIFHKTESPLRPDVDHAIATWEVSFRLAIKSQEWALWPLVCRRVEEAHAVIKRIQTRKLTAMPSFVSAEVRFTENMELLSSPAAHLFA